MELEQELIEVKTRKIEIKEKEYGMETIIK